MGAERLNRSEWMVRIVPHRESKEFVERYHYSRSCSNTSVVSHGLFRLDSDELLGVCIWLPPTPNAARSVTREGFCWRNVIACSRLAVHPEVPKNGASFLLGASMRMLDHRWDTLLTYADTRFGHTGAIYKATNWICLGEVKGADNWISAEGQLMGRKRGGRNIPVKEMVKSGFSRLPPKPKVKFVFYRN